MKLDFVGLHNHSEYSLLDGYGKPEQFVKRAKELGQKAIAVTDHGNISAHFKWYNACREVGIKPILGCEMYVVDDINKKERDYYHITILAKNLQGYRNLMKLVSYSYNEGFYYKPKVDWEILKKYSKGLIAFSGCPSGRTGTMFKNGSNEKDIITELKRQQNIFDDYFIEIQPWSFELGKNYANLIYKLAEQTKIPVVMTMDCHYPLKEDAKIQDVLLCVQTNAKFDDPNRMKFDQQDFYLKSGEQMRDDWNKCFPNLKFKKEFLDNTVKIADMIDFEFPMAKPIVYPYKGDKKKLLRFLVNRGIKDLGLKLNKEYKDRIDRELQLIIEKDFVDYFLVIADLINWTKKHDIFVGPARGSSCGSLVCYLTHITEIDPIPFGLLFERFIDINRSDLPDIDIDIEDERREEVKNYLRLKYGFDKVSSLATFGTFLGRLCIQDVARVFNISGNPLNPEGTSEIAELKKLIVQRSGGDSRFGYSVEDTLNSFDRAREILKKYPDLQYAKYLEGGVRHMGVHAAGTIVANEPIENFAAFYRSNKGEKVISMDYDDASGVGLLKIDLLGLTAMSVIKRTLGLIKERHNIKVDLRKLELNDEKVFQAFRDSKLFGIFQFDGAAMMSVCKQVKPQNFLELAAVNALSRPGPLHSGGTQDYIERKFGRKEVVYLHPILKELTQETYGVTIYQEQVMMIVKNLGNFTWEQTSTIRKIMSKNVGVESFNKFEEQFVKGASENGVNEKLAKEIWGKIYSFGSWAFNKSHCIAYTVIGYWMMWMKIYYPVEFYVSMLQKENDEDRVRKVLKEFSNEGHPILGIDINKSLESFSIDGDGIRIGLSEIKGVGVETAKDIVKMRMEKQFESVGDFKTRFGQKTLTDKLMRVGVMKDLPMGIINNQMDLFGDANQDLSYKKVNIKDLAELCPILIHDELHRDWDAYCKENMGIKISSIKELESLSYDWNEVAIIGRTDPNKRFNPKNKIEESKSKGNPIVMEKGKTERDYDFINFDLEDETDFTTVRMSPKDYKVYFDMLWDVKPTDVLLVIGSARGDIRMMFAKSVINLTQYKEKRKLSGVQKLSIKRFATPEEDEWQ